MPIRTLPKVSLHEHLDGSVRPATIVVLAAEAGIALPATDADGLDRWFAAARESGSLPGYLAAFEVTTAVLQTAPALTRAARELVADLVADGVVYAEVRWAPELHVAGALDLDEAVTAVAEGLAQGEEAAERAGTPIRTAQLLCALRQGTAVDDIARLTVRRRDAGVVGFDLAGPEEGFPPSAHRAAFDRLAAHFVPVTVHAGEGAGVDSLRSALLDARALRLGHGVRLASDIEVVSREGEDVFVRFGDVSRWVRDREIALEVCPSSNLQTGAVSAWGEEMADHPVDLLHQLGFTVTISPDNRTVSGTTLTRELGLLVDAFGYGLDELEEFQLDAAAAAFLGVDEREELIEVVAEGFARARR